LPSPGLRPLPESYVALIIAFTTVRDAAAARAVLASMQRAAPDARPGWLALCAGLFRAGLGGAPALAGPLAGRRLRGVWDEAGDRARPWPSWPRLAGWIADRAFAADPALVEVEVRVDHERLHLPGGPAAYAAHPLHRERRRRPSESLPRSGRAA
jgi:hypothetical protein